MILSNTKVDRQHASQGSGYDVITTSGDLYVTSLTLSVLLYVVSSTTYLHASYWTQWTVFKQIADDRYDS